MDEAVRSNLTRLERVLIQQVPPVLWSRGVCFRCRHRSATSKKPARYRVTTSWTIPPIDRELPEGVRPGETSVSTSCENPNVELLIMSLPEFVDDLLRSTSET